MKFLIFLQSLGFAAVLTCVGCAHRNPVYVDTTPIAQGLETIDQHFLSIQKEKDKRLINAIAETGRKEVVATKQKLTLADTQILKLAGERDWWKSDSAAKDETLLKKEQAIGKYQKKLNFLGVLLALATAWLAFNLLGLFTPYVTPQLAAYAFMGRAIAAGLVFLAVFTWVRYL